MSDLSVSSESIALSTRARPIKAWAISLVGGLFFFYEFIQMNMFNSLAGSLAATFHLSAFQIGLVSAFYFLADSILLYPAGVLVDRLSSRRVIIYGMVMCIIGTLLIASASSSWFLVVARFLEGISAAFCLLSILRLASQWLPENRMATASGLIVTIGMLGGAVSQTPLTMMIEQWGWREALYVVALIGVILLVVVVIVVKDAPTAKQHAKLQTAADKVGFWQTLVILVKNPQNWLIGLYIALMNLPIMLLGGLFGSHFMQQGHGFSATEAATINMMIFIGTIVGSTVVGFVSDFLKQRRLPMIVAAVVSLVIFLIILYAHGLTYADYISLFFLLGFFTAAQILGYPAAQASNPAKIVGSALGFVSVIIMTAPTLLQPLTGWLMGLAGGHLINGVMQYSLISYQYALQILVIGFVISIFCAYKLPETYKK
ncbi:sugar (and other) transporter family protein [Piscirickettsia salmonis]|uniref:Regulatory protein UhpC n=1 Tax=Piscirickettsia salmonis TaxID=1238 RepID=A0A9Q5VFW2_PISSA|nr:MFS transporter [Piscirickettsia salmonis]APS50498.1 sugar (and other) transporter family protein [Piscirickettsia salmonis]APS53700.1 sugar (and other) transporter family protein [Piscirickettsia salmonis]APS56768.1 sugar (and other) transporter family protein [Piscirickettsia salmonis]ERL60518.1 sugar (and other) transporter family protein [Piscirickettsia salmonis LF-89 = ATCC VR-1361]PEQ17116.1 MFS transporter [Piscirickettsia salmonis]